jgi:hypothetical protein
VQLQDGLQSFYKDDLDVRIDARATVQNGKESVIVSYSYRSTILVRFEVPGPLGANIEAQLRQVEFLTQFALP